ncbi:nucleoside phosphatase GDA1/CD39, partial [Blyttiomyces helicus]
YGVVIDAGSSGSRAMVYSWKDPLYVRKIAEKKGKAGKEMLVGLPVIEKGDEKGHAWQFREEPGISTFAKHPEKIGDHLRPLLDFATSVIPKHKLSSTPVYLLATAGLRLVPAPAREAILAHTCDFVRSHYPFAIDGGCELHFRLISGELEGIYGWIAVNYLKNGFGGRDDAGHVNYGKHTYGFLDMGGASTQIAFEPTNEMARLHGDDLTPMKMRSIDGTEMKYSVFVTTFLGFGMNEARRRYIDSKAPVISDPCLPSGLSMDDINHAPKNTAHPPLLRGTGSFKTCLAAQLPLLNKSRPCSNSPCLFNGVHAPIADFGVHDFLGVSEYWYTSSDIYGLGGVYDHASFLAKSEEFCGYSWDHMLDLHARNTWPAVTDSARLRLQCFKSAWIINVLHEGLGIPRDRVTVANHTKSRTAGSFESVDEIADFSVSWTLGAILLHAVATVPP